MAWAAGRAKNSQKSGRYGIDQALSGSSNRQEIVEAVESRGSFAGRRVAPNHHVTGGKRSKRAAASRHFYCSSALGCLLRISRSIMMLHSLAPFLPAFPGDVAG